MTKHEFKKLLKGVISEALHEEMLTIKDEYKNEIKKTLVEIFSKLKSKSTPKKSTFNFVEENIQPTKTFSKNSDINKILSEVKPFALNEERESHGEYIEPTPLPSSTSSPVVNLSPDTIMKNIRNAQ